MVALYYPLSVGLTFYQKWFIKVVNFFILNLKNGNIFGDSPWCFFLFFSKGSCKIKQVIELHKYIQLSF